MHLSNIQTYNEQNNSIQVFSTLRFQPVPKDKGKVGVVHDIVWNNNVKTAYY